MLIGPARLTKEQLNIIDMVGQAERLRTKAETLSNGLAKAAQMIIDQSKEIERLKAENEELKKEVKDAAELAWRRVSS